jgi:hypothetical protein
MYQTVGKTEGSIMFAGNKPTRQFLRRYTGYVEQFGEEAQGCVGWGLMARGAPLGQRWWAPC